MSEAVISPEALKRPSRASRAAAMLLIAGFVTIFFLPVVSGMGSLFFYDHALIFFPFRQFFASAMKSGHVPLWCPEIFCGFPLFAETQANPFYPPFVILFTLFPAWLGYSLLHAFQFYAAAFGTYFFARRRRLHPLACATAAVVFTFALPVTAHLHHTNVLTAMTLLPWLLLAVDHCFSSGRLTAFAILALLFAAYLFGCHPQIAALSMPFTGAYFLWRIAVARGRIRSRHTWWMLAAAGGAAVLALAVYAVQLLPFLELVRLSPRHGVTEVFGDSSIPAGMLINMLFPNYYGSSADGTFWGIYSHDLYSEIPFFIGIIPLGLAFIGFKLERNRFVGFFAVSFLVAFLLSLGRNSVLYSALAALPVFSMTRFPARIMFIAAFSLAILAAFGVDRVLKQDSAEKLRKCRLHFSILCLTCIGLVYVCVGIFLVPAWLTDVRTLSLRMLGDPDLEKLLSGFFSTTLPRDLLVQTLCCGLGIVFFFAVTGQKGRRMKAAATIALSVIIFAELANAVRAPVAVISPRLYSEPPEWYRGIKDELGPYRLFRLNIPNHWHTPGPNGVLSPHTQGWKRGPDRYIGAAGTMPPNMNLLWNVPLVGGFDALQTRRSRAITGKPDSRGALTPVEWNPVLNMLCARYIIASEKQDNKNWRLLYDRGPFLYENTEALPRAFIVDQARTAPDDETLVELLRSGKVDFRRTVFIEGEVPAQRADSPRKLPAAQKARIISETSDKVIIQAELVRKGHLVLADAYYPGWQVSVDGVPAELLRANYILRAVELAPGTHKVVFEYRPRSVFRGAVISAISLLLVLILLLVGIVFRVRVHSESSSFDAVLCEPANPRALRRTLQCLLILLVLSPVVCRPKWRTFFKMLSTECRVNYYPAASLSDFYKSEYLHDKRSFDALRKHRNLFLAEDRLRGAYARTLKKMAESLNSSEPELAEEILSEAETLLGEQSEGEDAGRRQDAAE